MPANTLELSWFSILLGSYGAVESVLLSRARTKVGSLIIQSVSVFVIYKTANAKNKMMQENLLWVAP